MQSKQALEFINSFLDDTVTILNKRNQRSLSNEGYKKKLSKFLDYFYASWFRTYLRSSLGVRDFEDDECEKNERRKCFFIQKREGVKFGYGIESNTDTTFFCYMGGDHSLTFNDYSEILVLGDIDGGLKIIAKISFDYDSFHKTGKIGWKNNKKSNNTKWGIL